MKGRVYIQIIVLLLLGFEPLYSMEKDTDDPVSIPTSQAPTEQEESSSDSGNISPASSMSSGAETTHFSRDLIAANQKIFEEVLRKACEKKQYDQDLTDQILDYGVELYNQDRGRYSTLLGVPKTGAQKQAQRACLNLLLEEITIDLKRRQWPSSPRQEPIPHPSKSEATHIKRNIAVAGLLCGIGVCCLATGAILMAAVWQSVEHLHD